MIGFAPRTGNLNGLSTKLTDIRHAHCRKELNTGKKYQVISIKLFNSFNQNLTFARQKFYIFDYLTHSKPNMNIITTVRRTRKSIVP